MVSNLSKSGMK